MNDNSKFFKIGVFVITATFILITGLIIFGAGEFFDKKFYCETYFDESVQGLNIGSSVKYKGMDIGSVESIESSANTYDQDSQYILVLFSINNNAMFAKSKKGIEEIVKQGLRVKLGMQGLTGAAYIEADYIEKSKLSDPSISWEPENPYIPSTTSTITRLTDSISRIVEGIESIQFHSLANDLATLLKTLDTKISNMHTEQILDSTLTLVQNAGRIVNNAEKPLSGFLNDLEQAGKDVKIVAKDTKTLIQNLDNSLSGVSPAVKQFKEACKQVNETVYFRKHDLEIMFDHLKKMSANLEELSEDLKTYPGSIIYSSPPNTTD
ncbi:MAG: MlaD family protein [Desulfobacteraceae bacterium]|nr:MlaD family protein [Desulfobacteraceae bacterium]